MYVMKGLAQLRNILKFINILTLFVERPYFSKKFALDVFKSFRLERYNFFLTAHTIIKALIYI